MNLFSFVRPNGTEGAALNSRGQIAWKVSSWPLLWSPAAPNTTTGTHVTIDNADGRVIAINDYGQVLGSGYLWTPSQANGPTGTTFTDNRFIHALGLNNYGQVLLYNAFDGSESIKLFTPSAPHGTAGTFTVIPSRPGSVETWIPVAINNAGTVAGFGCTADLATDTYPCRVFLWVPASANAPTGTLTQIEPPAGIVSMSVVDINDSGHLLGTMMGREGKMSPYLYADGKVYDVSAADAALRHADVEPIALNKAGQMVFAKPAVISSIGTVLLATPEADPSPLTLSVSETEITFTPALGQSGLFTRDVQVLLGGTGASSAAWTVSRIEGPVIDFSPFFGIGSGAFTIRSYYQAASPGKYETILYVQAGSQSRTIRVVINVPWPPSSPPFGVVDIPANGATVSGAIGVSGWALDDVAVNRVEVWRKAVAGEPNMNGQVYIGTGIFLDGARPDVANAYPGAVFNTRAGWGMQILTNMLPSSSAGGMRGNGQHQLFVYAFDAEGKSTLLGSPVIQVNNATAARPFGTLDTPASGATVSGSMYTVWGWAFTPQPAIIPTDGSMIWVFVDGVSLGHPVYNLYRPDVSTLFPGLQNSTGPVGYYYLDTRKLTLGMHSIAWSVTDSLGHVEGIGSRLFYVWNSIPASASDAVPVKQARRAERDGVWLRTGYDPDAPLRQLAGDQIIIEQGDRIELHVAGAVAVECNGDAGLPVGATFRDGVFYWQLDPAFIASYELRFRDRNGVELNRVAVRVTR